MSELCDLSAVELRRKIVSREISPVELLDSCLGRIEAVNPRLNAVVAMDVDAARKAARAAEEQVTKAETLGLLHGLPLGIKDLNETAGLRTTYGSPLFRDFVPQTDCGVVASMREAGGVILAKTNTPEFGAGANTWNDVYGATGNPFDPDKTCAGSSGGSAVALATGMLPLCNGSDLGGSLRTPASFCGVVGLRPTSGLVPDESRTVAFSPLPVEGPMGRTVADVALLLASQVRNDVRDPYARFWRNPESFAVLEPVDLGRLRVAFSEDLGFAPVSQEVRDCFRDRRAKLAALFGTAEERDPDMGDADRIFEILRGVNFLAAHLQKVRESPDQVGPNVRANVELALTHTAEDVAWASAEHTRLYQRFTTFMQDLDLLIVPAAAVTPFPKSQNHPTEIDGKPLSSYIRWVALSYGLTLTTRPVLCVPCGTDRHGMPFGLQLVGRRFHEARLLAIGAALEAAMQHLPSCGRPVPDLSKLTGHG